jgi:hypothetical protein
MKSRLLQKEERDRRKKVYDEAVGFMKDNPTVPFDVVGEKFGISFMTASRLWRAAGYGVRAGGRKAGISPLKKGWGPINE